MITEILAQVEGKMRNAPFTAGIVLWDDRVVEAAPILMFMKRKKFTRDQVREHCKKFGWRVSIVHQLQRSDR